MAVARDIAQIAAGPLAAVINALGARKVHRWTIINWDVGQQIEGQFAPISPTKSPGNPVYADHTSLNRDKPITQFINGTADRFTFTAMWFAVFEKDDTPEKRIAVLETWKNRDPNFLRPPRLGFTVGDGQLAMFSVVLDALGDISYFDPPKHGGGIRGVTVPVTLKVYTPWELKSEPAPETRYHRAKQGEYFELISWNEYRNALMGDTIRKRHPEKLSLTDGDVVKLPSAEAIRTEPVRPTSITFFRSLLSKESPQKTLKQEVFDRNDRAYFSGTVPAGL